MSKGIIFNNFVSGALLVSTYVVCERLSVMHESAGVVEILVQILPEYPLFWSTVSEYPPPQKWKLSESKSESFRIPPLKMKIVRESKSESFRIPPTPKMKIVRESKSESFRIPLPKWKLSESPNLRVSEYPPPPKWKLSESPNPRVSEYPPPPKIGKTSDFKLQNSLKIREIYVETNL